MKKEIASEYDYFIDSKNCWRPMEGDNISKMVKISFGDNYVVLKGESVYSHSERGLAKYNHEIKIIQSSETKAKKVTT